MKSTRSGRTRPGDAPPPGPARRGGAVYHFSDEDLLRAMGVWLLSSASYRARLSLAPEPDAWEWLAAAPAQGALDAGAVLSHALTAQPGDLDRLVRAKRYLHGGGALLAAAWGQPDAPPEPEGAGEETDDGPTETVHAAAWRFFRRTWWWLIPACAVFGKLLGCLMALGGAR